MRAYIWFLLEFIYTRIHTGSSHQTKYGKHTIHLRCLISSLLFLPISSLVHLEMKNEPKTPSPLFLYEWTSIVLWNEIRALLNFKTGSPRGSCVQLQRSQTQGHKGQTQGYKRSTQREVAVNTRCTIIEPSTKGLTNRVVDQWIPSKEPRGNEMRNKCIENKIWVTCFLCMLM